MCPALSQPAPLLPKSLPENIVFILASLCQALAMHCATNLAIAPIDLLLWNRLHRMAERFQRLFARWSEGRLPAARPPASHPPDHQRPDSQPPDSGKHPKPAAAATEPKHSLPRGSAWLVKLLPQAAFYGPQLQYLLTNPQMVSFLSEAPQAGRILRPLCRMLGVQPLPQMLHPRDPNPGTPAPESVSLDRPPPMDPIIEPPTAGPPANKARPAIAENVAPGPPPSLPEDPRWVRPVSLWYRPTRPRP